MSSSRGTCKKGANDISRPKKWRLVESVPDNISFAPFGARQCDVDVQVLKVEEAEAIRLKDLLDLNQDECAEKMQVSRQTFQRILKAARSKIANALIQGQALRVQGGDYTENICRLHCGKCQHQWDESFENYRGVGIDGYHCPRCGALEVNCCRRKGSFCRKRCKCGRQ